MATRDVPSRGGAGEVFYPGVAPLADAGRQRVAAYRNALVICGHAAHVGDPALSGRHVLLADVLIDDPLGVRPLAEALVPRGRVRFDVHGGGLWAGNTRLGEVPVSSKEYFLLARLAAEIDHFVPYAELKHFALREASSTDQADDATFCQRLKSRIKKLWVHEIDVFVVTSNKGDGYRLRGYGGP